MKNKNILFTGIVLVLFACNTNPKAFIKSKNFSAEVIIDYGESKPLKEKTIIVNRPLTALEALQYTSNVETHPVGEYVFVCSIDSIRNIRGVKAWYYKINGESPGILAINNTINNGDTLKWIYKTDVCSHTVDNK
jgi:hypothetical protein